VISYGLRVACIVLGRDSVRGAGVNSGCIVYCLGTVSRVSLMSASDKCRNLGNCVVAGRNSRRLCIKEVFSFSKVMISIFCSHVSSCTLISA
jgi:hypothetical protein